MAPKEPDRLPARHRRFGKTIDKTTIDKSRDHASQNTLTPADMAPPWRGPAARKDAKHST